MQVPASVCVMCKGTKNLCKLGFCPVLRKMRAGRQVSAELKQDMFGPAGNVFVGSYNYPEVSVGPTMNLENTTADPKALFNKNYEEIIDAGTKTVFGKRFANITDRIKGEIREIAMSTRPVDVEARFTKVPEINVRFSAVTQPMGAAAPLKTLKQADNPKIPKIADEVSEGRIRAVDAVRELASHGFDNYYVTKVLSIGVLGMDANKRLVPTRWSITATDDMLGKQNMGLIRDQPEIGDIFVFENEFLHNHFFICLLPGRWEFENFEAWAPKSVWAAAETRAVVSEEYEPFEGRWSYADKQAGGYYASRVGVTEFLVRIRKQARVVVIREIDEGYIVPVGVWEVRENVRNAFRNAPTRLDDEAELREFISERTKNGKDYLRMSRVLGQTNLLGFLGS